MTQFILGVMEITLTMSAVAVLFLLLSKLFGQRFSAKCRYLVWLIIVVRLCIPFGTAFVPSLIEVELPAEVMQSVKDTTPADTSVNNDRPSTTTPVQNDPSTAKPTVPIDSGETQPVVLPEAPEPVKAPIQTFEMPSVETILTVCGYVWLVGAVAYLIISFARYGFSMHGLRKTLMPASDDTVRLYQKLCEKQKIRRAPALYISTLVSSPMLCGYFKSRIVLPKINLTPNSLVGILAHELTHYRRRDLWVKLLCILATSLHWFNPLVHIAAKRCNNEMELSCDESVLAGLDGEARLSYGNVMLDIIKRCRRPSGTLTTQFNPKKNAVKERFYGIMDMTKKKRGLWIIAAVVILCIVAGTVIGCNIGNNERTLPEGHWHAEGRYLSCDNGQKIIIIDAKDANPAYPCVMTAENDSVSFAGLNDGDRIKIEVMLISETYPAQTQVYNIDKLSDGERSDIDANMLAQLAEMGWIEASESAASLPEELSSLFSMTVSEIRSEYGEMTVEYSEDGPGYPVYSLEKLPGVTVAYIWEMDVPLTDSMIPNELIITDKYENKVSHVSVGDSMNTVPGAWTADAYSVINGTVTLYADNGNYRISLVLSSEDGGWDMELPEDNDEFDAYIQTWLADFSKSPSGTVCQIRIKKTGLSADDSTDGTGPFVGYIKDAETDFIEIYTKENGKYLMSIPYAVAETFPATDRTNPAFTFGLMNADFYCGKIGEFVWAAVCTDTALNVANNNICTSSDGGKTWTIGDSSTLSSSRATGALFISENVGFMTHEYREELGPVLYRTTDGGKTWEQVTIEIPASMSEYRMTPQIPTFDGNTGVCQITGYDGNGKPLSGITLVTTDGGMSWMLRDSAAEQTPPGYTLLRQDNTIKLYAQNDRTDGSNTNFWLTYTDNYGGSQSLAFTGSGYDIAPDSAYPPRIYTTDVNGDYWYDIAIVFTTQNDTGVHNEELRLFAGWLNAEIPVESAVGYLNATLKITSDSEKWTLEHGDKAFTVGKAQFSDDTAADLFDEPAYHWNYSYHVLFDHIYCDMLLCCAGPLPGYANEYLRVGYTFGQDSFDGVDVSLRYTEGGTIMTTTDMWTNEYSNDTGSTDHFTLCMTDIGDALLEVTLDEYNIPFALSFAAEGQTKRFDEAVQLYGNTNIDIFRADGMTVFDKLYYGYGDTYVFHQGGVYTIHDYYNVELPYTTYLYTENGKIRFCRQSTQIRQADLVQTGFSAIAQTITSRDDFFRSYGKFSIDSDGNAVFTEDKRQTLSDVYDLDAEYAKFIKLYPNSYPATLDELIAKNSRSVPGGAPQALITYLYNGYLPEGATEILFCGKILANPYYICLFRTEPKSVCVYTIGDNLTHYNSVNVVIPDGYDYGSAEAIWAGGGGGSGESQFWVELTKNGVYTYLRYDNFAYTSFDDFFVYNFDGEVPSAEIISYAEAYGVPVKYPNTNTENSTDTEMNISIAEFTDESWAKLNYDGTISEQCREFFYNFVSGKSDIPEYNALGITDWKITRKDGLFNMFPAFIFEFTVTGDSLDALPPGHYVKYINDIRWTVMYNDVDIPTAQAQNTGSKYAQMVYRYLKSAYIWDIRNFGEWDGDVPVNYIIGQHGGDVMRYDDFVADAKRLFGIETIDDEKLSGLIYEADGIKMIQTGGTGSGYFADIPEVNEVGENYEVVVQLYADINGILPSHRLKYTLGKDGAFLRFEILKESRYEPEGLSRIYTK